MASGKVAYGMCHNQFAGGQISPMTSEKIPGHLGGWGSGGALNLTPGSALPHQVTRQWLHLKWGIVAASLLGDLWHLKEIMFAQQYYLTKSIIQVWLMRICQSGQENPRWGFCLLPLLSLYESTFWQLMKRKQAKDAENCSERKWKLFT